MHILSLSEFRAQASAMLDLVEKGDTVRILRHGKPVAELVPVQAQATEALPSWKQPFEPVRLADGAGLTAAVLEERERSVW